MRRKLTCLLMIGLSWCLSPAGFSAPVDCRDERLRFVGRWDVSEHQPPRCAWQGSSFQFTFEGTGAKAELSCDQEDFVRILVDHDSTGSRKIQLKQGRQTLPLASQLPPGTHTIEVIKETYCGPGYLTLEGLEINGKLIAQAQDAKLKLQFYGDSNLAGYSLSHERNQRGWEYVGCHFTFAGIAARALEAEYQNISVSGAGILGRANSVLEFYDRMDFYQPAPRWNFARFPVDICVINIGANDIGRKSDAELKEDFQKLILVARRAHPAAHLVLMNGHGWDRREPANFTREVVQESGDKQISCVTFPWLFNEWHGCEYDHAGMAQTLLDHLAELNPDWKQIHPIDVMSGFGRNDDVANGSFEQVAPFGGFGWRYFTDGAKRVHAPDSSPDGEWFLRIPRGSEVHQPNPAQQDTRYQVQLCLRSTASTATASVRLEFRDQQWRNDIPDSAKSHQVVLEQEWQEYKFEVTSPPQGESPSHAPWQIIIRVIARDGAVDCDHIRLTSLPARD